MIRDPQSFATLLAEVRQFIRSECMPLEQQIDQTDEIPEPLVQRMRELAVQASNGTLTSANRASMQLEVKQLSSEIDNIGKTANFNGIKLFDGSATQISLQTNINAGDVVKMSVGPMSSNTIGLGSRSSLQSYGLDADGQGITGTKLAAATSANSISKGLQAGDLVINGVMIGGSSAADDNASVGSKDSSAIAKAAAVNRASSLTGVTATVNQTIATGVATTAGTAGQIGTFTVNGITTGNITLVGNQSVDRATAVAAINAIAGASGVRAVDTGSNQTGAQLVADDGRNINVSFTAISAGTFAAANVGVNAVAGSAGGAQSVFTGTFTLQSTTSSPITITSTNTGDLTRAGLSVGTYAANTSIATGAGRASYTGTAVAGTSLLNAGDLVINGVAVGASLASDDAASSGLSTAGRKDTSAIAIAAAINKVSGQTGVKAVAQANTYVGSGFTAAAQSAGGLLLNGVNIAIVTTTSSKAADVVTQINAYSSATGVVASDNGSGLSLSAADGRNIEIGIDASAGSALTLGSLGLTASAIETANGRGLTLVSGSVGGGLTVLNAGVNLVSDKSFTVAAGSSSTALSALKTLGFTEGTFGGSNNGTKISSVDISTVAGANDALNAVDAALGQISDQRSNLGAIQNRLQAAVDNLTSSSTNLQAAQGRIQDTDYSTTTTQMSKSQIISQAATAMLAQANQQPQMVLSLLK